MSLRNKFKATSLNSLKEQDQEFNEKTGRRSNWADEYKIQPGRNVIRILPAHPDTGTYIKPFSSHWLPMYKKDENGEFIKDDDGKKVEGRRRIFNSVVHGDTKKDIIEEYISAVEKIANEKFGPYIKKREGLSKEDLENQKERDNFLIYIYGLYNSNDPSKSVQSIRRDTIWMIYGLVEVDGSQKLLRVPLKKSVKDELLQKAIEQDDPDEMVSVDPYTDPDDGRRIFVTYKKKPNKQAGEKYYSVAIDLKRSTPITDEQIEELLKLPSLEELYVNSYKRKDFLTALEGLEYFDKKYGYGIFGTEEFQNTILIISDYYDEEEDESDNDQEKTQKQKEAPKQQTSRKKVEEVKEEKKDDLPFDGDKDEEPKEEEESKEEVKPTVSSSANRLAELRKKLGK